MYFGTNIYGWTLLAKRDGHEWSLEKAMLEAKESGVRGWEHYFASVDDVPEVMELAKKVGLEMHTAYIPGAFHTVELAEESKAKVLKISEALRAGGIRSVISNPDPLPEKAPKTDEEIRIQTTTLNDLGKELAQAGTRLLYHTHDPEMAADGRELRYTLDNTDPEAMGFCLDIHWVYRGAQNSQEILHDIISKYASRIELIHLRQSIDGVWTESIGPGDIDFPALAAHLEQNKVRSSLVLELCMEEGTPAVLSGAQANAEAMRYLEPILAPIANDPKDANESATPLRIYLCGAGVIAHRHAAAAAKLTNVQLFAADPSKTSRDTFAAAFPHATLYEDIDAMLTSSPAQDRDIAILSLPPWLHLSAGWAAAKSGRHVLTEKPAARTVGEVSEMIAATRSAGRRFGDCSVRFLGNAAMTRAREQIAAGAIGTPYHARLVNRNPRSRPGIEFQPTSTWFLSKEKAGAGVLFDWGVYDITMFFDVLRPVAARIHHAWIKTPTTAVDPPDNALTVETHAGAMMTLTLEDGTEIAFDYERASGFHGEPQAILNVDGSAGGIAWQWLPETKPGVTKIEDYVGDGTNGDIKAPEHTFTLTTHKDLEGKIDKVEEELEGFGWDVVFDRPLHSLVDTIDGRETVMPSEERIAFNFGVLSGILESAAEGKPVEIRLQSKPQATR